jgi:hypothetical protein
LDPFSDGLRRSVPLQWIGEGSTSYETIEIKDDNVVYPMSVSLFAMKSGLLLLSKLEVHSVLNVKLKMDF